MLTGGGASRALFTNMPASKLSRENHKAVTVITKIKRTSMLQIRFIYWLEAEITLVYIIFITYLSFLIFLGIL